MNQVTLYGDCVSGATVVSNRFIDLYMGNANDAQIKIYLYLLRCISGNMPVSIGTIADFFNYTEKDVLRALKYWEKQKLLKLSFNEQKQLSGIRLLPVSGASMAEDEEVLLKPAEPEKVETKVFKLPTKPNYSSEKLLEFKNKPEISQFLFVAEQYMRKTLNSNEVASFLYMYEQLGFDTNLLEYLVEHCVTNKKKSIHYIETVANSWASVGIRYVDEAREYTANAPEEIYQVFQAFGIKANRTPLEPELMYVRRWQSYGFSMELILEACERTVMAIHNPSFEYADKILSNWNKENVKSLSDVEKLDAKRKTAEKTATKSQPEKPEKTQSQNSGNKFNNFRQRTYDFAELEKEAFY